MEEKREMLELLRKIDKSNRQQVLMGRIRCFLALVVAVCCVLTFLAVYRLLPQFNEIIGQMQTVLGNLETTSEQLAAMDLEGMISDVDTLVVTGQQSLEQTMDKLNTIDLDALNQAIGDLADVVEPLARFFNAFS